MIPKAPLGQPFALDHRIAWPVELVNPRREVNPGWAGKASLTVVPEITSGKAARAGGGPEQIEHPRIHAAHAPG